MVRNGNLAMFIKLFLLFYVFKKALSEFQMTSYNIPSTCGAYINLKWKSIYTAELTFSSVQNITSFGNGLSGPTYNPLGSCDITVESWDFLNKLMVRFEEFSISSNCSESSLMLVDGLNNVVNLAGLPKQICGYHRDVVMYRSFVTSDKYLTIRLRGNRPHVDKLKLYITAFHDGICRSYEYPCANGRCIMGELSCNGYNPCGDNSDCPISTPQKVEDNSHPVLLAAIIALSVSIVLVIAGALVLCRCYRIRRKRRRQEHSPANGAEIVNSSSQDRPVNCERSVSQIEAESRYAPPSYSSLPVFIEQETEGNTEGPSTGENVKEDEFSNVKCYSEDSPNPPAYKCVMEHKEIFKVSQNDIRVEADTQDKSLQDND